MVGGSAGIGLATARLLAAEGASVTIAARDADRLRAAAADIGRTTASEVEWFCVDVTGEDAEAQLAARYGDGRGLDVLVVTVGGSIRGRFDSFGDDAWHDNYNMNVIGPVRVVRALLGSLEAGRSPAIVLLGAAGAKMPYVNQVVSNVHKAGLLALVKTLSHELAGKSIRVNAISPGRTLTRLWLDRAEQLAAEQGTHARRGDRGVRGRDPAGPLRRARRDRAGGRVRGLRAGQLHHRPVDLGGRRDRQGPAVSAPSSMTRRHEAVQYALNEIRSLRDTLGPSDELLDAVGPVLAGLALHEDLFNAETFAVDAGALMTIYELSVDPDGRLGLYASAGLPGKSQPPHDHRTWSVIAGVRGAEHNRYFERIDDGRDPQQGRLEPRGERTLRRGDANGMMGDAFHTIRVLDEGPAMHLHLYGYPLDRLDGRIYFDSPAGGVERPFMGRPDLRTAKVTAAELAAMRADGEELAVLDTRDVAAHARGHVPGSCPVPAPDLELRLSGLLPRRAVRVVVIGEDDMAAHRPATGSAGSASRTWRC